jgi:small subunit ribosomal protein S21
MMQVEVREDFEGSIRVFQKLVGRSGLLKELRLRRFYEKPSVRRNRKMRENQERRRRNQYRIERAIARQEGQQTTGFGPCWRFIYRGAECFKVEVPRKEMSQR